MLRRRRPTGYVRGVADSRFHEATGALRPNGLRSGRRRLADGFSAGPPRPDRDAEVLAPWQVPPTPATAPDSQVSGTNPITVKKELIS